MQILSGRFAGLMTRVGLPRWLAKHLRVVTYEFFGPRQSDFFGKGLAVAWIASRRILKIS